jgi:hypothetical protein
MFKSLVASVAAVSMLMTPVVAEARSDRGHHAERSHGNHDRGHRRGVSGGDIALGIGAFILGAAVASSRDDRRRDDRNYDKRYYDDHEYYDDRGYYPQRVCFEEQIVEYYYGRRYVRYEYRCR